MPDNKQTREAVRKANEELTKAKNWGIGVAAAREKLKKANEEFFSNK